jgi:hypothetical protein
MRWPLLSASIWCRETVFLPKSFILLILSVGQQTAGRACPKLKACIAAIAAEPPSNLAKRRIAAAQSGILHGGLSGICRQPTAGTNG